VDMERVARRWFSPGEAADVGARGQERFLWYWVLKEAYAKACGMGLAVGFDRVVFGDGGDAIHLAVDGEPVTDWWFDVIEIQDFLVGIAAAGESVSVTLLDYAAER